MTEEIKKKTNNKGVRRAPRKNTRTKKENLESKGKVTKRPYKKRNEQKTESNTNW